MASRYEIRSVIIQTLFECDFRETLDSEHAMEVLTRNVREELELEQNPEFAESILLGVILKREVLDEIIVKAAPDWPIQKISIVDRALLRLGLFELLFGETYNIPQKVAINEAIELSKAFGGDSSRKFVNGVLGAIFKEMNPGENSNKIDKNKEVVVEELVGGFVFKIEEDTIKIGFILDPFKVFTLPKGHIVEGLNEIESLKTIVLNEATLDVLPTTKLDENTYTAENKEKIIKKHVSYFICELIKEHKFIETESVKDFKWFSQMQIKDIKVYKDMEKMIEKAFNSFEINK